jgi:hypothetical protein
LPPLLPQALDTLDDFNTIPNSNGGKDIYLTSNDDITANPKWIEGIKPNDKGEIVEKTGVVVIVEKGDGVVDVFYFYFWGFNHGGRVLGRELGESRAKPMFSESAKGMC